MKFDKKTLDMLSSLPDDKLWQVIKMIASTTGIKLGDKKPDKEQMAGLRAAMGNLTDGDLERATEIIDIYKGGDENGKPGK